MKKILITSPSLDAKDNISGISSLISDILNNSKSNITHFLIGRKDGEKKNVLWLAQISLNYIHFVWLSLFKDYKIIHINSSMESPAIIRDLIFSIIAKKLFNNKVLLLVHGGYYLINQPTNKLLSFMIKALFKCADLVIVLSIQDKEMLTHSY